MQTLTALDDPQDPQDCADCLANGDVCPFHQGYAAGWDAAAEVVGRFVVLAPTAAEVN